MVTVIGKYNLKNHLLEGNKRLDCLRFQDGQKFHIILTQFQPISNSLQYSKVLKIVSNPTSDLIN